jgi:hypothetical protein
MGCPLDRQCIKANSFTGFGPIYDSFQWIVGLGRTLPAEPQNVDQSANYKAMCPVCASVFLTRRMTSVVESGVSSSVLATGNPRQWGSQRVQLLSPAYVPYRVAS